MKWLTTGKEVGYGNYIDGRTERQNPDKEMCLVVYLRGDDANGMLETFGCSFSWDTICMKNATFEEGNLKLYSQLTSKPTAFFLQIIQ